MGLSTTTVTEGIQFCIFDLRRGQHEGQELDKILFFFPTDCPFSTQLSVIGLSEGLITFTRIFSPEAACEVIEAERHSHVFYQAEPDIWMVMVVEKNKETAIWRIEALQRVLKEVHSLFVMFHGSIRVLLEKEPGGGLVRIHLYSFITDYLTDFFAGKKLQLPSFLDCLKERGTVQMLTVGRDAAIDVESLVRVLESSCVPGNTPCNSLILFQDLLVSTTLSPVLTVCDGSLSIPTTDFKFLKSLPFSCCSWQEDTVNLFTYAVLRLTPHVVSSATSSWSYLRKASTVSSQVATGSILANAGSAIEDIYASRDTSPVGQSQRFHVPRPLQRDKWSKGKDGFLVTDIWGAQVDNLVSAAPTVWLKHTEERMHLCVYQHKNLTIILLIPPSSLRNEEQGLSIVKQQLLENASVKILKVEEKLTRGWGGENAYHVAGYRYLLFDSDKNISRASPPGKVTTLTKDSLLALNKLREEVDLEKLRTKRDDPNRENDLEICIRARNNAWVIARTSRGKELYMVLEKANETLLYASDAVDKFSNRYCTGALSFD